MKVEKGMYFRTYNGIIRKASGDIENKEYSNLFGINAIKISSYNIIDLIESGDYVNGHKVEYIETVPNEQIDRVMVIDTDNFQDVDVIGIYEEDVETIVTKEQFECIGFEIGGDK